jgi:uncharacterized metal-binding protein YceD (DUF177 family)
MTKILDSYYNPEHIQGQTLRGQILLSCEDNELSDVVQDASLTANVSFETTKVQGRWLLQGALTVDVTLLCQRTFEPFVHTISSEFKVVAIKPDDLAGLDQELEPILLNEKGLIDLKSFLREEIVLSLPMFPVHPASEAGQLGPLS